MKTDVYAASSISRTSIGSILDHPDGTALVVGFVSPHCDFPGVAETVRALIPDGTVFLLVSSAGELSCKFGTSPYSATEPEWDRIVLTSFSRRIFSDVALYAVPLPSKDIRDGHLNMTKDDRIREISGSLDNISPPFPCDFHNTFVLTFVDGLSNCEHYLLEAIYNSGRFPLVFIGGSAGGKLDFQRTYLFDGSRVLENHALLCFVKLAAGKRYSIFKTQNFRRTDTSFMVANTIRDLRLVQSVVSPTNYKTMTFVEALASTLKCEMSEVKSRLHGMTFGVEVGGELYIRDVKSFNLSDGSASFYCDVDFGDRLYLLEPTDFISTTRNDFALFLKGKPRPIGALFFDCLSRRLKNLDDLARVDVFDGVQLAGFSTFGELFGLNINLTLTAIFFFPDEGPFVDDIIDRFPVHYASFSGYFDRQAATRMKMLVEMHREQEGIRSQLRREHQFSEAMISSLPGIFFLLNDSGALVLSNQNMESVTGLTPDDLMVKHVEDLCVPEDRVHLKKSISNAVSNGKSASEVRLVDHKGKVFPTTLRHTPLNSKVSVT